MIRVGIQKTLEAITLDRHSRHVRVSRMMVEASIIALGMAAFTIKPLPPADSSLNQYVYPTAIASTAVVNVPTVSVGAATVAPSRIESSAVVNSPVVEREAFDQNITFQRIASTSAVNQPLVTVEGGDQFVVPTRIESSAQVNEPSISTLANVAPQRIESTSEVPNPALTTGPVAVTFERIEGASAVNAPNVAPGPVAIAPEAIQGAAVVNSPSVAPGDVTIAPETLPSTAVVNAPTVEPGEAPAQAITFETITNQSSFPTTTVGRGPVTITPTRIASTATIPTTGSVGRGAVTISPAAIPSTSSVPSPTVQVEAPAGEWFDDPKWDWAQHLIVDGQAAVATGPKVGNKYPKRAATLEEVLSVVAGAGRGRMVTPNGGYQYDLGANLARVSADRGSPQLIVEPIARVALLWPSGVFNAPRTISLENRLHVIRMRGSGSIVASGPTISGGSYTLAGQGANAQVWGIFTPTGTGDVTFTPTGDVRDVMVDSQNNNGQRPDWPTIPVQTTTGSAEQAAEVVRTGSTVVAAIARQGTILIQGQLFARPFTDTGGDGHRTFLGWEYNGRLEMRSTGSIFCTAGGGNFEIPTGHAADDPFSVALSFRERDEAGGFPADRPGITRMSVNGSTALHYEQRYGAGLGDHNEMHLGREHGIYRAQTLGAGGFSVLAFSPDLMTQAELQALSAYPGLVPGASPIRQI